MDFGFVGKLSKFLSHLFRPVNTVILLLSFNLQLYFRFLFERFIPLPFIRVSLKGQIKVPISDRQLLFNLFGDWRLFFVRSLMLVLNEYQLNEYVASIGKLNINFVHFSYNYYLNTFFPTMSTIASLAYLVPVAVAIHATLIDKENGLEIVSSWRS